jgi:GTP-binding protein EngB required for normal cell division
MPFTPQCQSFIQRPPFKVAMIRLLYQKPDGTFAFFSPRRRENHEYGMLSHVWQIDEEDEVTYQDILDNTGHTKLGYRKLQLCADWARHDGIRYFWCDTCCINQASSVEQNEAITCMFQWYAGAKRCWVYLKDVTRSIDNEPNVHWKSQFQRSSWFTRGWTLQELLAPPSVHFYSDDSAPLGDRNSLCEEISNRAAIPEEVIRNPSTRNNYSFEERMKWSQNRDTRFEEDGAYCLMGLWGVRFTPDYGESEVSAFQRLKKAIDKKAQAETPSLPAPPSQEEGKWSLDFMFVLDVVFKIFFTLTALAALYGVLPLEIRSAYVQYLPGLDVSVSVQSLAYTELNTSWPVFAILGKTGVGKSSFIDVLGARNLTTGLGPVVCEGLESCGSCLNSYTHHTANTRLGTEDYSFYAAQLDFGDVYVVDTPGFDDSKGRSDEDILISIWDELDRLYKGNTRLKGIIYLYDISAQRIGGMSTRVSLRML